jgi:hypothetical protein
MASCSLFSRTNSLQNERGKKEKKKKKKKKKETRVLLATKRRTDLLLVNFQTRDGVCSLFSQTNRSRCFGNVAYRKKVVKNENKYTAEILVAISLIHCILIIFLKEW